ncbi:MAG: MBL fold metallo-hydrolase [Lentisphaerae bacterium]|nr:MBL fold metallo-hydrolase [Lentisphaerota bacterium]
MIIKTLVENTSVSEDYGSQHGLSLYIETNDKKFLFDVGASELFFENAKKMDVNISDIDFLIISHGHYDHGGGLKDFLEENKAADIYLHGKAFEKHFDLRDNGELHYIGLEKSLVQNRRFILTSDRFFINKGIWVFSNIVQIEPLPASNKGLLAEQNGQIIDDTFAHEQNLVIEEDGRTFLLTGCAHNGIVNILKYFYTLTGRMPDYVIGGFHLYNHSKKQDESPDVVDKIGLFLLETNAQYYTCHCTGIESYERLKTVMGDRINYLSTGSNIEI